MSIKDPNNFNFIKALKMKLSVVSFDEVIDYVFEICNKKEASYICAANVHMCIETFYSKDIQKYVNSANIVVPDGRPLFWLLRFYGHKNSQHIRGLDLTTGVIKRAHQNNISIGFYGSTKENIEAIVKNLNKSYKGINIGYQYSPPFKRLTKEEETTIQDQINASGIRILFIGLGCPKQERWMFQNKTKLNCLMIGVGAVFDFLASTKSSAPRFVQYLGLEWLFRFIHEPKRLFLRYFSYNPKFIFFIILQIFGKKYE